jgi:cell division septum initiation protein DivIVA
MTPREAELSQLLEQCQAALAQSLRENELLRQKIDLLVRRVFGSSSEKLDPEVDPILWTGKRRN